MVKKLKKSLALRDQRIKELELQVNNAEKDQNRRVEDEANNVVNNPANVNIERQPQQLQHQKQEISHEALIHIDQPDLTDQIHVASSPLSEAKDLAHSLNITPRNDRLKKLLPYTATVQQVRGTTTYKKTAFC